MYVYMCIGIIYVSLCTIIMYVYRHHRLPQPPMPPVFLVWGEGCELPFKLNYTPFFTHGHWRLGSWYGSYTVSFAFRGVSISPGVELYTHVSGLIQHRWILGNPNKEYLNRGLGAGGISRIWAWRIFLVLYDILVPNFLFGRTTCSMHGTACPVDRQVTKSLALLIGKVNPVWSRWGVSLRPRGSRVLDKHILLLREHWGNKDQEAQLCVGLLEVS